MPQPPLPTGQLQGSRGLAGEHARTKSDSGWVVIVLAGIAAATHIWKLPNALASIQAELGISLVFAGLLIGIIQVASMLGGLLVAWSGEVFGLRRLLVFGLLLLAGGSLLGASAPGAAVLMVSRTVEGVGFLLCTVLAPPLIQRSCAPERMTIAMASWGAFQGTAALFGFSTAALALQVMDWRALWIVMAALALAPVVPVLRWVPRDPRTVMTAGSIPATGRRMRATLRHSAPWTAGAVFACYTVQWMAIMGFLPSVYSAAGLDKPWPGLLSAAVGGVNAVGALASGLLLQRGYRPRGLLMVTFGTMAVTSVAIFAVPWPSVAPGLAGQFTFAMIFSLFGGMAPAILTRVAVGLAPPDGSVPTVIGLMQQIFNIGNFAGPPLMAWIATATGGWQATWWMTCGFGLLGAVMTLRLTRSTGERRRRDNTMGLWQRRKLPTPGH